MSEPLTGFFPASGASGMEEDEARNRRGCQKPPSLSSGGLDAGYGQETGRRLCPTTPGPLYLRGCCFDRLEKTLRSTNILAPTLKTTGDGTVSFRRSNSSAGGSTGGVLVRPAPGAQPQPARYWLAVRVASTRGCHGPTLLDWNCYPQTLPAPTSEAESWW